MKYTKRLRRFAPRVEGLEDRTVPSGNVTAEVNEGILSLVGDDQSNQIYVGPRGVNNVFIASHDGTTTINGQLGPIFLDDVTSGVEASFGLGNDYLAMAGVHPFSFIQIDTGEGDDGIVFFDVSANNNTSITTGAGNDAVFIMESELDDDVTIDLGAGDDRLSISSSEFRRNINFIGGDGVDVFGFVNLDLRELPNGVGFEGVFETIIPIAQNDLATTAQKGTVVVPVAANDVATGSTLDPASITITRQPSAGIATPNPDGTVTYVNNGSGIATDTFAYTIRNVAGATSTEGTVIVALTGTSPPSPPSPPVNPPTPGAPGVTVASTAPTTTNVAPIPFTITFDEGVTGFTQSEPVVTNGTAAALTAIDSKTYTLSVTPSGQGVVTVAVPAGVAQDSDNNGNTASNTLTRTFDSLAPVVTSESLTTNDTTPSLTGTVDDSTATVSVSVGGQTIAATVSSATWTALVPTPLAAGTYTISVTGTDGAGNAGSTTNTNGLVINTAGPSVAVTTDAPDPTGLSPSTYTATFSADVTGFTQSDIQVVNGTVSGFTAGTARAYTFTVTPAGSGTLTVTVPAGVAIDSSGNANTAGSVSRTVDASPPTVDTTTTAPEPTNLDSIPYRVTFSEDVTGFVASDVVVLNGTLSNFVAVDQRTFTFDVAPREDGEVTVWVPPSAAQDSLGNLNAGGTPLDRTSDRTAPTVEITSDAPDPTDTTPIPFTATFDEDVTGFAAGDISVTNGSVIEFSVVDALTYTFNVVPGAQGEVRVTIPADGANDLAGNGNAASADVTRNYNGPVTAADITSTETDPTNAPSIPITVQFTDDVAGFDESDLQVTNGSVSKFTPVDANTFTFDVAPTVDGDVVVAISAGAATGVGGIPTSADSFTIVSDRTAPTATVSSIAAPTTNQAPISFTVTFSEMVTGFDKTDLTILNGTASDVSPVDKLTYSFTVAPGVEGDVTVTVNVDAATDDAGNNSLVSSPFTVLYDTTPPNAPTITGLDPATDTGSLNNDGVTQNQTPTFVGTADAGTIIVVSADSGGGPVSIGKATADGSGAWQLIPATVLTDATYTVTATATDAAGNTSPLSGSFNLVIDTTDPTADAKTTTISPTNDTSIPVTVEFSENVTGFDQDDITIENGSISGFAPVDGKTYTFNVAPGIDGTVTIRVNADGGQDLAGNGNTTDSITLTFDAALPTVNVNPLATTAIIGTSSDALSGVTAVGITIFNGTNYWTGMAFDGTDPTIFLDATTLDNWANWSFDFSTPGTYTVNARATDAAGNQAFHEETVVVGGP